MCLDHSRVLYLKMEMVLQNSLLPKLLLKLLHLPTLMLDLSHHLSLIINLFLDHSTSYHHLFHTSSSYLDHSKVLYLKMELVLQNSLLQNLLKLLCLPTAIVADAA